MGEEFYQKILLNQRIIELKGLNISPRLYFDVAKFLSNKIYCVFKTHSIIIYLYEILTINNKVTYKGTRINFDKTVELIIENFKINIDLAADILDEWLREQKINTYIQIRNKKGK